MDLKPFVNRKRPKNINYHLWKRGLESKDRSRIGENKLSQTIELLFNQGKLWSGVHRKGHYLSGFVIICGPVITSCLPSHTFLAWNFYRSYSISASSLYREYEGHKFCPLFHRPLIERNGTWKSDIENHAWGTSIKLSSDLDKGILELWLELV